MPILQKRFTYDYQTNRAVKFDDHFTFPWTLDMTPYTVDGIQVCHSVSGLPGPKNLDSQIRVQISPD